MTIKDRTWISISTVTALAVLTIFCADQLLANFAPARQLREVQDGVQDYSASNPDTLVLGSSHARTLHVLGQELSRRTHGRSTLVAVPLENGKIVPYSWVFRHRLLPLIDERDRHGELIRSNLRRLILVTEWWDSCPYAGSLYWNLPGRAWTFTDFAKDVFEHGITGFNRNYLQTQFRRLFSKSSLVFDRTQHVLVKRMAQAVIAGNISGPRPEQVASEYRNWRANVEAGVRCIGDPTQMKALEEILDAASARHLEVTILLFPRKPGTLTEKARQTTLPQFANLIHGVADPRGVRFVDLTVAEPITDDDFMDDFDHINATGNKKFATWALDHDLRFLQSNLAGERQ